MSLKGLIKEMCGEDKTQSPQNLNGCCCGPIISNKFYGLRSPGKRVIHLALRGTNNPICSTWAKFGPWEIAKINQPNAKICQKCITASHKLGLSISKEEKISIKMQNNENGKNNRLYSVNSSVFNSIDTEEKAYWLGFLLADGWVTSEKNKYKLGITLAAKDREHLERFKKFMQSGHKISSTQNGKYYSIIIGSKDLVQNLSIWGMVPRKSKNLVYPMLPNHFVERHFIRGFFDGDGWISHSSHYGLAFGIVSGCQTFLHVLQQHLAKSCDLNPNNLYADKRKSGTVSMQYGGNKQCKRIYDFLYSEATIYLSRKKKVWNLVFPDGEDK